VVEAFADDAKPAAVDANTAQLPAVKAWSPYQVIKAPTEPSVKQKKWVRTPVDAFILEKLEAKGVAPSPEADRATFIRRATLDAWGLLPTPE
ncbi:DUF1549 domain-containing protein, partial [Acinetobacter baumannii]